MNDRKQTPEGKRKMFLLHPAHSPAPLLTTRLLGTQAIGITTCLVWGHVIKSKTYGVLGSEV